MAQSEKIHLPTTVSCRENLEIASKIINMVGPFKTSSGAIKVY